jgi:hypothetical protein
MIFWLVLKLLEMISYRNQNVEGFWFCLGGFCMDFGLFRRILLKILFWHGEIFEFP